MMRRIFFEIDSKEEEISGDVIPEASDQRNEDPIVQ